MTRRIGFLGFDSVQALDLFGPADAFASDAFHRLASDARTDVPPNPYEVVVIGLAGKSFRTSSGILVHADVSTSTKRPLRLDTLVIPGGSGLRRPGVAERAAAWITAVAPTVRRIASVCTGIYGLAPTGLLDGRCVATHWTASRDVARLWPTLRVDDNALYVKDGRFYTSAGVTAGIDLALAMIEEDHGPAVSLAVARELVVYLKRPGGQSQFSEELEFQTQTSDRFRDLTAWIRSHLRGDLSVEALAARACISPRHFARAFKEEVGATPAAFVEELRLAEASQRLTQSTRRVGVDVVARSVGYSSESVFRRAFERRFCVTPTDYRKRFSVAPGHRAQRASIT